MTPALVNRFRSRSSRPSGRPARRRSSLRDVEVLEGRELLSTFTVTSHKGSGAGSLRQAIIDANNNPGADTIKFDVTGTIRVGKTSLPAITDTVDIDGTSASGFSGSPLVTVNFQGTRGLRFAGGSDGSMLESLSLVRAGGAGVTLVASHITVQGNYIGVTANGSTVAGNGGDGIRIDASSTGDLIGQVDPVTGVSYYNTNAIHSMTVTAWTGIRDGFSSGQYLITGAAGNEGVLYVGPISGIGAGIPVNFPGASTTTTSPYGPDIVGGDVLRIVGTYNTSDSNVTNGFVFQGTLSDLTNSANYQTVDDSTSNDGTLTNTTYTFLHSTMGDLVVGNGGEGAADTDGAFIYSLSQGKILTTITYPAAQVAGTSAYGVWYNGGTSYTIAGGYTATGTAGPISQGYLVDYDEATGQFSNWASFAGPEGIFGPSAITHFQGISSPEPGVYTMSADTGAPGGSPTLIQAALTTVRRSPDGSFGPADWVNLNYPGSTGLGSANSVAGNQVVGITNSHDGIIPFQATVNLGAQTSNVISGNKGNGIGIYGASGNRIAMNNIGTNSAGTQRRGNAQNGILLTRGASNNVIGGTIAAGNDPTNGVIVRPPQGNLISGNRGNGVLMTGGATGNTMSGNFVGTTPDGDAALGNRQDGVAIVRASGNSLIGCTMQDQPFVYYNVLSGNGGNGLRITNSNDTTVQANFLGAAADNTQIVPNRRDGLLVSGHSSETQVGGVIPLGNVISGNRQNGIEVAQKASGFTSFNTFGGTYAFGGAAPNGRDGILVTSSGGNNLIRTSIISGNLGNGIHLSGHATGVQITETATGTDSKLATAVPNRLNGILIDGHAHDNSVGGFQPSIEPQITASGNDKYGIVVAGSARNNAIFHANIGTNGPGDSAVPNTLGGIAILGNSSGTTVGGSSAPFQNKIGFNTGPGVTIRSSRGNSVLGNAISGNASDGVMLVRARKTTIGGNGSTSQLAAGQGNRIMINQGYGLMALGNCNGSLVEDNTIVANAQGNVNISRARGITYVPNSAR